MAFRIQYQENIGASKNKDPKSKKKRIEIFRQKKKERNIYIKKKIKEVRSEIFLFCS